VVHHQSEDYNLGTALRQTSSGFLLGWIFYLPLAVAGVPPLVFGVVALIDLLYQFWVHTQQVGKLGWFDRWFCSPSNHRAHHAVNERYLDKNYGGILILWDRLFGSFVEEDDRDPVVYGTRAPLRSFNPLWANLQVYRDLWLDSWRTRSWADKLRVWFKPPGWRPADAARQWPRPDFDIHRVQRFDPPLSPRAAALACALFITVLGGLGAFLWNVHRLSLGEQLAGSTAIVAALWAIGALSQPRPTPAPVKAPVPLRR
jgi:Fatty acid hydroxylase superfamily